jgi:RNA polymerase sigma factor (sigma-70 family)
MFRFKIINDEDLIRRIRENDRSVLGEIFLRYDRMVCAYIQSNGGSHDDAEDMLQESVIALWQQVCSGTFEVKARLSTYVMAIAKNKWLAELRRRRHHSQDSAADELETLDPNPLQEALDGERLEHFRLAFDQLQPVCRQLLTLYYFEERSMNNIAEIMNFANSDVAKSKKYQCLKALEKLLGRRQVNVGRSNQ